MPGLVCSNGVVPAKASNNSVVPGVVCSRGHRRCTLVLQRSFSSTATWLWLNSSHTEFPSAESQSENTINT